MAHLRSSVAAAGLLVLVLASGCQQPASATKTPPNEGVSAAAQTQVPPTPLLTPETFDVAALAERVKPMVVNITTTHEARMGGRPAFDPFDFFFGGPRGGGAPPETTQRQSALGTGFIIDPAGYVVTNAHVVEEADEVRVRLSDERELEADVVGRDRKLDLALLKLQNATNLPSAPLGDSSGLRVGEFVLAVGNPFGLGHTITLGIVSAKARTIGAGPYDDFIQTDASINPGNSGGPLFNGRGEVVGINTAIRAGANGIGFAIPVDALKDVLQQLREKGFVERGKLGLAFQAVTADLGKALGLDGAKGALVTDIEPGGSAARAGIAPGDVVLQVNGTAIAHAEELPRHVARNAPGSEIRVSVWRAGKALELKAKLDAMPGEADEGPARKAPATTSGQSADRLGIQVSDAQGGGVLVEGLLPGSPVTELRPGDVVVEMNGAPVTTVKDLKAQLTKATGGSTALVKVRRGGRVAFAAVPVPK
jgi:serine protease Do